MVTSIFGLGKQLSTGNATASQSRQRLQSALPVAVHVKKPIPEFEAAMGVIRLDMSCGRWSAAPNDLVENENLSPEARFFVVWCLAKPPSWRLRVEHFQEKMGWGDHKWQRIYRELVAAGYAVYELVRIEGGQFSRDLLVRATPLPPDPDFPGLVDPDVADPHVGDQGDYLKQSKTRLNKNNNTAAQAVGQTKEVVVDAQLIESGLLSDLEVRKLRAAALTLAGKINDAQTIADEVCGQIRAKGRLGQRGIKHPVRLLKALANSQTLDFSNGERELRQFRKQAAARLSAQPTEACRQAQSTARPPPPEVAEYIARLRKKAAYQRTKNDR